MSQGASTNTVARHLEISDKTTHVHSFFANEETEA